MNANKIIELLELVSLENGYQENIALWNEYMQGSVEGFHTFSQWNGQENIKIELSTLGMPKKGCEDWADMSYNPETTITVDEAWQERLYEILSESDFESKINIEIERGYGLGTMGIVTSNINGIPKVLFASADMMYPVYEGNTFAWAVISQYEPTVYSVSLHYEKKNNLYRVRNFVIKEENKELIVLSDATAKSEYKLDVDKTYQEPMLHIFKPAIANNLDPYTQYGISIFANAIAESQGVDIAFNGMQEDIRTGDRVRFATVDNLENMEGTPKFPKTKDFYIMEGQQTFSDGTSLKFETPELRADSYVRALQTTLNLFGRKIGLGDDYYGFDNGTVYTNRAQVISTNSKLFKTRQKMLTVLEHVLIRMVRSLYLLDTTRLYQGEVSVNFDDSIIHDKEEEATHLQFLLMNNLISPVYYFMETMGLEEDLAIAFVKRQQELRELQELPEEEGGIE